MTTEMVFAGIDTTAGKRPMTCAILNDRRRIIHLSDHNFDSLIAQLTQYENIICAIDAPGGKNLGIMSDPDYRESLGLTRGSRRFAGYRVAEYEIRRRGIPIYATPVTISRSSEWIAEGWRIYDTLRQKGFRDYPSESHRVIFETYPHANYTVLIGARPYNKNSLEGRIQRQLVLNESGVAIKDPMHLVEEWTRYRFMTGRIELDNFFQHDQLDALIAAYTAYRSITEPEEVTAVGDARDGLIVLPVGELREMY